jgi:hypothetical protein
MSTSAHDPPAENEISRVCKGWAPQVAVGDTLLCKKAGEEGTEEEEAELGLVPGWGEEPGGQGKSRDSTQVQDTVTAHVHMVWLHCRCLI